MVKKCQEKVGGQGNAAGQGGFLKKIIIQEDFLSQWKVGGQEKLRKKFCGQGKNLKNFWSQGKIDVQGKLINLLFK